MCIDGLDLSSKCAQVKAVRSGAPRGMEMIEQGKQRRLEPGSYGCGLPMSLGLALIKFPRAQIESKRSSRGSFVSRDFNAFKQYLGLFLIEMYRNRNPRKRLETG